VPEFGVGSVSVSDEHPSGDDLPSAIPLAGELALEEVLRTELPELADPVRIGHFEDFRRIGRGGFGVVYRARDRRLGRDVAVKLCSNPEPDVIEAFQREAEVLAMFSHPNIVTLYDVGWHGEDFFYDGVDRGLRRGALHLA
jgi:serine/threonine protein kinase